MSSVTNVPHEDYYQKYNLGARPPPNQRKFVSKAIDDLIAKTKSQMKDQDLATLFENCFPNTLDTTVNNYTVVNGIPDTFVVTGDIPAMWLRDSFNQVFPYLPYASQDPHLQSMLLGVLYRQAKSITIDPYANAFNFNNNTPSPWMSDKRTPPMSNALWEGKYELDSIAAFLRYSYYYYVNTKDTTPFSSTVWTNAVYKVVDTIKTQQKGTAQDQPAAYSFQRETTAPTDTLMHGTGVPANYTGMSKSPFRPSDDAHTLPFPIAANAMAVHALNQVATIFDMLNNKAYGDQMRALASEMQNAIAKYGVINHPQYGQIYAYEVDGFGNSYFMDDANVPSLLSLPYLNWCDKTDPTYINTRKFLLSPNNPYYFTGKVANGIGGPHVGYGYIWPLAIVMQAQTSNDDNEIMQCLDWLKASSAGTGFMHESFWKDNASQFTRPWFAWVNGQFGHLILTLVAERPHLIFN
jgi:meiotically up-regulated gene 157 (Mug157) protein